MFSGWGIRDQRTEDDTAVRRFAGDQLKDGGGADLYMDVSGCTRGAGEGSRHKMKLSMAALVENHLALNKISQENSRKFLLLWEILRVGSAE
jgi:hypothetical protein